MRLLPTRICALGQQFTDNVGKAKGMNDGAIQEGSTGKLSIPKRVLAVYRNLIPFNSVAVAATWLRVAFVGLEPTC